jgi:hypothetical protein
MNSLKSIPVLLKRLQIRAQETLRRRIKVTSSLNEIATDQLENWVVGEEERRYSAYPPPLSITGFWTDIERRRERFFLQFGYLLLFFFLFQCICFA